MKPGLEWLCFDWEPDARPVAVDTGPVSAAPGRNRFSCVTRAISSSLLAEADQVNRRRFLCGLALGTLTAPFVGEAQQVARVPRVGVLSPGPAPPEDPFAQREAFEGGLRNLGWAPGSNISIEYRYAKGDRNSLPLLARELVCQ